MTECLCCKKEIQKERPRICPECNHEFSGNGIDGHWRAHHEEDVMTYEEFWNSLCDDHKN